MKLKHISALFFLLFVFSFAGVSQVEDEEVQMFSFSGTRGLGAANMHDFGVLKDQPATFTLELRNKEKTDMKMGRVLIPQGVGVMLSKDVVKPGESVEVVITIEPKYLDKGDFKSKIILSTLTQDDKGTVITKTAAFNLKAQVL